MQIKLEIPVEPERLAEWCRNIDGHCPLGPLARCPLQKDVPDGLTSVCLTVTPEMWQAVALPEGESQCG